MKMPKAKKLQSGSWRVQIMIDGRRISVTKDTEREAVSAAIAYKAGILKEKKNPLSITLGEAMERFIDAKDGILSPSTLRGYDTYRRNQFLDLQKFKLCDITNERIQREASKMSKNGKSPKYVKNVTGFVSTVLASYYEEFKMSVSTPPLVPMEQRRISKDEMTQIFKAVEGSNVEVPVLLALWLGLRISEVCGLKTEFIKNKKIHIKQAKVYDRHGNFVEKKSAKTFKGDRWVGLPDYILDKIDMSNEYITNLRPSSITGKMHRLCKKAGIEHFRFHDLRHANAAVMVRLGIDSKYAQERNGWATDYMYKQVYAYTMDDMMDEVDDKVNKFFEGRLDG